MSPIDDLKQWQAQYVSLVQQAGALASSLAPIVIALQQPTGEEVTGTASFWYTPDLPPHVEQYQFLCLQRSVNIQQRLGALSPDTQTYLYADPVVKRSSDMSGYTQCLPPSQITASMLYNGSPGRVRDGVTDVMVNPGNLSFQTASSIWLAQQALDASAEGVLFDEIDMDPTWGFESSRGRVTPAQHQANLLSYLRRVAPYLRAHGVKSGINLGANYWPVTDWVNAVVAEVDTVWLEQFICRELSRYVEPATLGDMWEEQVLFAQWVTQHPSHMKSLVVNAATSDPAKIRYAFLSYLLVSDSYNFFGAQAGGNGTNADLIGLRVLAQSLGNPTGGMLLDKGLGVARRNFQHGIVTVYPTPGHWRESGVDLV